MAIAENTPNLSTKGKILIVDDEESLRLTFQMFLRREGYDPVAVSTFDDALSAIKNTEFDLIISDIVLEGSSGIDLLRHIRQEGLKCPVVMITGYPNVKTAADAVRLGAFDYIPKPVTKEALLRTTKMALTQRALEMEKERAEAERERYRHYLETIFRSVRDAIITVDKNFKIVEMNHSANKWLKDLLGYVPIGIPINQIPGIMGASCIKDVETVIRTRQDVPEHRVECEKPDGSRKVLGVSAAPLDDGKGNFLGVVLVARDLTRLEDLEQRGRRTRFYRLVGQSQPMQIVYTLIENLGKVDTTVLITGESGTGKELVAEALHGESNRSKNPLVKVDCTAIPEELLENELFGHRKGAFTGATGDRKGRILSADGGTLFLDEIGDISLKMQLRLLRFLQEKTFYPVGSDKPIKVDVRVIAATNVDLKKKVQEGGFREDLYFRLKVVDIMLPPLRERKEDIPLLVQHFINRFKHKMGKEITGISDQAMNILLSYSWPGNVRELEHIVERACVLCGGETISERDLPEEIRVPESVRPHPPASPAATAKPIELRQPAQPPPSHGLPKEGSSEIQAIIDALKKTGGNKAKAARILGIDRSTLYRKLREHNIDVKSIIGI